MKALTLVCFALFAQVAYSAGVSVKKDGTQITSEPKKGAAVVMEVKKGDILEASDRTGMFWKVKTTDGKEGFVSVMAVQRQAGGENGIQNALHNAAMKARESGSEGDSARARSAVMGVRGLSEDSNLAEVGSIKPDLRAVYRMEDRMLSGKRLDRLESLVQKEAENAMEARAK